MLTDSKDPPMPDHLRLYTKIAYLYFREGMTQQEISRKLEISRQSVGRILKKAEEEGIVTISINSPALRNIDGREAELERRFGLKEAVVVSAVEASEEAIKAAIGEAAASLLAQRVAERSTIAVSWSSTVFKCAQALADNRGLGASVVMLNGSLDRTDIPTGGERIIKAFADSFGGQSFILPAPMIVDSPDIRRSLLSDSRFYSIYETACKAEYCVFGVGEISERSSLYQTGYVSAGLLGQLREAGAVGEICGKFFDREGKICIPFLDDSTMAVPLESLRSRKLSIALAGGRDKVPAILGMLRGGYCNVLVTTEETARGLLAASGAEAGRDA
jgi:deoxyribonucleoside regulator